MVSSQQKLSSSSENIQSWLDGLTATSSPAEIEVIRRACTLAEPLYDGQLEITGTPLLQHTLGSAEILMGMHLDHETIAATILHAVPEYLDDWAEKLQKDFGFSLHPLHEALVAEINLLTEFGP